MLRELYIENFAVIKSANIAFADGFTVFTGVTGAGKSILINALNAVIGQRISKEIIRSGEDKAVVVAVFDDDLVITREVSRDGRSMARINNRPVSVAELREIGENLLNIHGQHDSQILLNSDKHLDIIDNFSDNNSIISEYQSSFRKLQEITKKCINLSKENTNIDKYREIVAEIGGLDIKPNEDEIVEAEFEIAQNSEYILSNLFGAISDNESAVELLNTAIMLMEKSEVSDDLNKRLKTSKIEISDIISELKNRAEKIKIDSARYEFLKERRSELIKIKKKYGADLEGIYNIYKNSLSELENIEKYNEILDSAIAEKENLLKITTQKATELSNNRRKNAEIFSSRVADELAFLNMPNVRFEVRCEKGKLSINGFDNVEFLISVNRGEELKPISKIASGGELSRIMLVLKSVLAEKDEVQTLIFDEIDSGVSGSAAQKIAIKLEEISKLRQIICVTHLAQIAVKANTHYLIEKTIDSDTQTNIKKMDKTDRIYEIARIIEGENPSELTLKTAKELLGG
jgi:DNA repair protein RecN (Recombination protein N)